MIDERKTRRDSENIKEDHRENDQESSDIDMKRIRNNFERVE